jgi:hypothetical protein
MLPKQTRPIGEAGLKRDSCLEAVKKFDERKAKLRSEERSNLGPDGKFS